MKACPRCQGDMYDSTDIYGVYAVCLQCGHNIFQIILAGQRRSETAPATLDRERPSRPRLRHN